MSLISSNNRETVMSRHHELLQSKVKLPGPTTEQWREAIYYLAIGGFRKNYFNPGYPDPSGYTGAGWNTVTMPAFAQPISTKIYTKATVHVAMTYMWEESQGLADYVCDYSIAWKFIKGYYSNATETPSGTATGDQPPTEVVATMETESDNYVKLTLSASPGAIAAGDSCTGYVELTLEGEYTQDEIKSDMDTLNAAAVASDIPWWTPNGEDNHRLIAVEFDADRNASTGPVTSSSFAVRKTNRCLMHRGDGTTSESSFVQAVGVDASPSLEIVACDAEVRFLDASKQPKTSSYIAIEYSQPTPMDWTFPTRSTATCTTGGDPFPQSDEPATKVRCTATYGRGYVFLYNSTAWGRFTEITVDKAECPLS